MIHTGRWVYRKYKRHRAEKEELIESARAKHSDLCEEAQEEIAKTAVDQLGKPATRSDEQQDHPPSYSKIEEDSPITYKSMQDLYSPLKSSTSLPQQLAPLVNGPGDASPSTSSRAQSPPAPSALSPTTSDLGSSRPMDIPVHGKWVWIPDAPPTSTLGHRPIPRVTVNAHGAAELPTVDIFTELPSTPRSTRSSDDDQARSFVVAELDGQPLAAGVVNTSRWMKT